MDIIAKYFGSTRPCVELREKLIALSHDGAPAKWRAHLCRQWMQAETESCGVFYIDEDRRIADILRLSKVQ